MAERRPNIVFILTDDHASHAISSYGSKINATPRIDEIARCGVRLENMFCTNALCAPSRASLLTGTYSHVNGVRTLSTPIDAGQPTFVGRLQENGYRTGLVGKWHLGQGAPHDPQGFDYWDVLIDQGEYIDPRFYSAAGTRRVRGYATDLITDLGLDWVDGLPGEEPWCLLLHHKAPHRPWTPDPAHPGHHDPIPLPTTFEDDYATRSTAVRHAVMRVADDLTSTDLKIDPPSGLDAEAAARWKYQRYLEDYLAVIDSVDANVGRVIDWLRERGDFDDTVLVYASDQGFFLGDHGWFDKRFMYEESLRMPFLISCPRHVPAGQSYAGLSTNVDVAQTLLQASGLSAPERMQGRSFWPDLTTGPVEPPAEGMYYRYWEHDFCPHHVFAHYGYRTERYKIIFYYADGMGVPGSNPERYPPEWELYDLRDDPSELRNVYADPRYDAVRTDLRHRLRRAQEAVGDEPHPSEADLPG